MSTDTSFDVIIIGTGQAGVPLATRLASAGKRVLIAERGRPGGTCVNAGCTPTKTLVASARVAHVARTAKRFGVNTGEVTLDFSAVMAREHAIVKRWRDGVEKHLAGASQALRLERGHAKLVGERTVAVNGARFSAENVVLNVGARPTRPSLAGLNDVPALTSTGMLELTTLPKHLLVLGAGYIACEFGQMFRRFGAEVTLSAPSTRLLSHEDPAASDALRGVFESEGIRLELGKRAERVSRVGEDVELTFADGSKLRGSHLLLATGRTPNTHDLGCDAAGVKLGDDGKIIVGERYETSAPGIFAVGDCTPGPQFTHVSWDDHRVLFDILTGKPARLRNDRIVPYAVFTDPQVAGVGVTEAQAKERGIPHEVATMPFGNIARAIETDELAGNIKLLIDPETEHFLGVSIVGADAGELIHVFSVLMQAKVSARAIVEGEFVHPTFGEGLQSAVMKLPRYALT